MIEEVLGSKNKIKLLRYLIKSKDWHFNLSEISKKIGLDKGSISKLIKELETKNILEVKRSGKLLLFKLKNQYYELVSEIIKLEKKWSK